MSTVEVKSYRFRKERESSWLSLEQLLGDVDRAGLKSLSAAELSQLPVLYRSVLASLSVARGISLDRNVRLYLESLATRAYLCVYGMHRSFHETLASFVALRFPLEVRRNVPAMAVSAVCLVAGILIGFLLTAQDVDNYYMLVPAGLAQGRLPTSAPEELREVLYRKSDVADLLLAFATALFSHNAQCGLLAFALGFALGIPVFYLLFANGAALGAMAGLYHRAGLAADFWGWVLPHGVTELGGIVLCGGAGLMIAGAVILPGHHTRLDNLKIAGRRAGILVLGAVGMFALAGWIEGFFRQLVQNVSLRYLAAGAGAIAWALYFRGMGRPGASWEKILRIERGRGTPKI